MLNRFMDIDILKASEGRLPSILSGYIDRQNGKSATTGERFRWRHRSHDLVFTKVIVPEGVRKAYRRPAFLWAKMERAEIRKTPRRTGKHKLTKSELAALIKQIEAPGPKLLSHEVLAPAWRDDAQLAYHIVLPLPHEFSIKQNWAMVVKFILRELRAHGYICQVAMHRPDPESPLNWHVHLLVATREVDGGKLGNKIRGVLADFTNRPGGSGYISKDVSWPDRWLAYQQDFARRYGIALKSSPKPAVRVPHIRSAKRIKNSDRNAALEEAKADAAAALLVPGLLPEVLTEHRPTFTPAEAFDLLTRHRHSPVDADSVIEALKHLPGLVPLFEPETGRFSGRFTTASVREEERDLAAAAAELHRRKTSPTRHRRSHEAVQQLTAQVGDDALAKALAAAAGPSRLALIEPAGISRTRLLVALVKACRQAGYTCLELAPNAGGAGVAGSYSRRRSLARELRIQERLEAGTYDAGTTKDDTGRSDRRPPSRKAKDAPKPWTDETCIILRGADQLDAATLLRLLDWAAKTGARVILIGSIEPRTALGRGGAYAVVRSAISSAVTPTTSAKPAAALPGVPLDDARQPSLAFAAPSDRRAATATPGSAQLPPPAPRPWRWPDAGLMDIHNLSLGNDCDEIRRRLAKLPPTETLNVYQTLPRISDSVGNKPNPHPLAGLHRQVLGQLRRAGIDGRLGRTDVDCLKAVQLTSKQSWRNRPDLAPRRGFVDVRSLLAAIAATDMADWHILREHMKLFPKWVLRDIVRGLDDLFITTQSDEVRYAISVAKLQIWVMAKDSGRDLVPEIPRRDLWSHISSAERIHPNVHFDDKDGAVPLILAATLPPPGYRPPQQIVVLPRRTPRNEQPLWLQRPAWSPLGDYGVHPDSGERCSHFVRLCRATPEQREQYQNSLLRLYASVEDLAMRACCAVGLQHCASWHRQTATPMPIELEIVDAYANYAVLDWRFAGGSKGNSFQAARAQIGLERLARKFLDADDRDQQRALAEKIAAIRQYPAMPASLQQLLAAAQAPANHLRLQSGAPDPIVFGALLADLARRLPEPLDRAPGKPAQSGTETPPRSHDPAVDVIAASRGASASGHGPRAM